MQKYNSVRTCLADLAIRTKSLVQDPDVSPDVVMDFRMTLGELKKAHDNMIGQLCTEMMEELIPIGVDLMVHGDRKV